MVERFIQPGTFGFKNALSDPEPGFSQQRKTLARVPRIWVDCANDDFMDSRGNDCIGAWGGSAPGATRLEADVKGSPSRGVTATLRITHRFDFGVRSTSLMMPAASEDASPFDQNR